MAFISCLLKSEVLQSTVDVKLYFPCDLPEYVGNKVNGVITLLHGYTGCGDDWLQMTAASRYAADNGLVLIAPSVGNCFYNDMAYGGAYFTFINEEMPLLLQKIFKIPTERKNNFIAGLSMGGYGALLLALSKPQQYAAAASFSGAVDLSLMLEHGDKDMMKAILAPVFGDELKLKSEQNLFELAKKVSQLPKGEQPRILCTCGNQDMETYMIKVQNDRFAALASTLPLDYTYKCWDGIHEWSFWDRSLVVAIDWFLHNDYAARKLSDWSTPETK
ncbi:MAG: alpha/beta hydrolase-fold protein [Oscillospiraceae bacterium]